MHEERVLLLGSAPVVRLYRKRRKRIVIKNLSEYQPTIALLIEVTDKNDDRELTLSELKRVCIHQRL